MAPRNPPRKPPEKASLDAIKHPAIPPGRQARRAAKSAVAEAQELESKRLENEKAALANKRAELKNAELTDRLRQRKLYAKWTFLLVGGWLTIVLVLLLLQGFGAFAGRLSEKVLIATVATTTVNVLGMLAIILHGLYPDAKD